jgi:hypothetical protein
MGTVVLPGRVCGGGGALTGRGIHNSALSIAGVKNEWSYTSSFSLVLRGVDRENFTKK